VKALLQDRFGPPEVLRLADIGLPEAGAGDVLVRTAPTPWPARPRACTPWSRATRAARSSSP